MMHVVYVRTRRAERKSVCVVKVSLGCWLVAAAVVVCVCVSVGEEFRLRWNNCQPVVLSACVLGKQCLADLSVKTCQPKRDETS